MTTDERQATRKVDWLVLIFLYGIAAVAGLNVYLQNYGMATYLCLWFLIMLKEVPTHKR